MLTLKFFDLLVNIDFQENSTLPIHALLQQYVSHEIAQAADLMIHVVQNPIHQKQWPHYSGSPFEKIETDDGILFMYKSGQFAADRAFTKVQLWSPYDRKISLQRDGFPNFNGDPGLRLILWARAAIDGCCYLHGALNVLDDKYILFLGDSGVGKTTLSRLACNLGGSCLTEENPFLGWKDNSPIAYGTPWPGPMGPDVPKSGEIAALFFLRHAAENSLQRLDHALASRRLLHNARIFRWLPHTVPKAIDLLNTVSRSVAAYDFGFVPDHSAIEAIRKVL